jgi:hypothetical protein
MEALTLDDLLPLDELVRRRRELFAAHARYLDRYRRVRVGPRLTLVFENRQTLWFRVQEVVRIARLDVRTERDRLQAQLDLHNRLLPRRDCLQAALVINADESRWDEEMAPWRELRGEQVALQLGARRYPANLLTCRPEDRAAGAAHWVQFVLGAEARACLADPAEPAVFTARLPQYHHDSGPLCDDVRHSLLDDLRAA